MRNKISNLLRRKSMVSNLFSIGLYLGCLIYVFILGFQCLGKYQHNIQSVNISFEMASNYPFPDFTFCPTKDNQESLFMPKPYEMDFFEECNVNLSNYIYHGPWVGQGTNDKCTDPKAFNQASTAGFHDLKLDNISLLTFANEFPILEPNDTGLWIKRPQRDHGNCYTLKIPQKQAKVGISAVKFRIRGSFDKPISLDLYIHGHGLFLNYLPHQSSAGIRLRSPFRALIPIEHEVIQLPDHDGKRCMDQIDYDLSECRDAFIFNESMKLFNCTTPFGLIQDHICTSKDINFTDQVAFFHSNLTLAVAGLSNTECPFPCQFQKFRILREFYSEEDSNDTDINIMLLFDPWVKVTHAYFSYTTLELIAEFGGYVGLFLGISICHLSFAFDKLLDIIWQSIKVATKPSFNKNQSNDQETKIKQNNNKSEQ